MPAPQTVNVVNMSDTGLTVDLSHNDGVSEAIAVTDLPYGSDPAGITNTTIIQVAHTPCGTVSFYPMAGGPNAQYLHYLKLMSQSLPEVQAIAVSRGLTDVGTQADLAVAIIQDECSKQSVQFFNLQHN